MVGDNHASFHPSFLTTRHQTSTFAEHTTINEPFHECWPSRHGILVLISSACPSGVKNRVVHRSIQTTMKTCTNRLRWWNKSSEMIGPAITNWNNPTIKENEIQYLHGSLVSSNYKFQHPCSQSSMPSALLQSTHPPVNKSKHIDLAMKT